MASIGGCDEVMIIVKHSKLVHSASQPVKLQAGQQVNRVGKYLYKNLDGAFKIKNSSNTCDIYSTVLYQIPYLQRIPGKGTEYNDVHEMTINLNITTYQNKVRINIIEMDPNERTIGYDLYDPETLKDLEFATKLIYSKVCKRISKAYEDYDFLF